MYIYFVYTDAFENKVNRMVVILFSLRKLVKLNWDYYPRSNKYIKVQLFKFFIQFLLSIRNFNSDWTRFKTFHSITIGTYLMFRQWQLLYLFTIFFTELFFFQSNCTVMYLLKKKYTFHFLIFLSLVIFTSEARDAKSSRFSLNNHSFLSFSLVNQRACKYFVLAHYFCLDFFFHTLPMNSSIEI